MQSGKGQWLTVREREREIAYVDDGMVDDGGPPKRIASIRLTDKKAEGGQQTFSFFSLVLDNYVGTVSHPSVYFHCVCTCTLVRSKKVYMNSALADGHWDDDSLFLGWRTLACCRCICLELVLVRYFAVRTS